MKRIFGYSAWGKYKIELEINVDLGRDITEKDERNAREHAEKLIASLMEETYALDPTNKEIADKEREELLGLFGDRAIYVEDLPNGYCSSYCCKHLPWFDVTTNKGRIKIGWRKRVIQIDWENSTIQEDARTLFPDEDVTRFDKVIHAWGTQKAKEYIDKLLG